MSVLPSSYLRDPRFFVTQKTFENLAASAPFAAASHDLRPEERDQYYMKHALRAADLAATLGEVPVGAVVVGLLAVCSEVESDGAALAGAESAHANKHAAAQATLESANAAFAKSSDGAKTSATPEPTLKEVVLAVGYNQRETQHDPSAHAEFCALLETSQKLERWRLSDCCVYVTLEPCLMCAGLMVQARVGRCVYAAKDPKGGALGSLYNLSCDERLNHAFEVVHSPLEQEASRQLKAFFAARRNAHSK